MSDTNTLVPKCLLGKAQNSRPHMILRLDKGSETKRGENPSQGPTVTDDMWDHRAPLCSFRDSSLDQVQREPLTSPSLTVGTVSGCSVDHVVPLRKKIMKEEEKWIQAT